MIPDRLIKLRENKNLKQIEVARLLNIGTVTYNRYEKGEREPDHKMLIRLAFFFNVSIDYLLGATDIPDTVDDYITKQKKIGVQPIDNNYNPDEQKIIEMYRQLSEKDKGKIEGRLEEMLDDAQATTQGA